jgi:hypothetical protein
MRALNDRAGIAIPPLKCARLRQRCVSGLVLAWAVANNRAELDFDFGRAFLNFEPMRPR